MNVMPTSVSGLAMMLAASASNPAAGPARGPATQPSSAQSLPEPAVAQGAARQASPSAGSVAVDDRENTSGARPRSVQLSPRPGYIPQYDPSSPNGDPGADVVKQKRAEDAYRASLKAGYIADEMMSLIDIKT
ncbi:MAG: hypothetical protein EXQ89_00705 [Rhodospirillaceae bacterium]|nr:hypothetical protein [Rhodospirillaceae bacterium]